MKLLIEVADEIFEHSYCLGDCFKQPHSTRGIPLLYKSLAANL